jgi:hypothetical protein
MGRQPMESTMAQTHKTAIISTSPNNTSQMAFVFSFICAIAIGLFATFLRD